MIVAKRIEFDAAHHLPNYQGKCQHNHGHHWVVELAVKGKVDKQTGMVLDFTYLKHFLKGIEERFDHSDLNNSIDNPTAENIALRIKDIFKAWKKSNPPCGSGFDLAWIKVWETEDSMAMLEDS